MKKGWNFSSQVKLLLGGKRPGCRWPGRVVCALCDITRGQLPSEVRWNSGARLLPSAVCKGKPHFLSFTAEWTGGTVTNSSKVVAAQPEFMLLIISQWCNPFFGLCLYGEYKRGFSADVLLTARTSWTLHCRTEARRKKCCSASRSIPLLLFFFQSSHNGKRPPRHVRVKTKSCRPINTFEYVFLLI